MTKTFSSILVVLMLAAGCGGSAESTDSNTAAETNTGGGEANPGSGQMVGGGPDEHGCVHDGGYLWCARDNACVRPWEHATQHGYESSQANFEAYCSGH